MASFEGRGSLKLRLEAPLVTVGGVFLWYLAFMTMNGPPPGTTLALLSAMVGGAWWTLVRWRASRPGTIRGGESGVSMNGRLVVRRRHVDAATVLARSNTVRLWRRWLGPLDVVVGSKEEAAALIEALGLGTGQSIAVFWATYGTRGRRVLVSVLAVLASLALARVLAPGLRRGTPPAALLFLGLPLAAAALTLSARVLVGSDGVLVRRRIAPSRFVSFGAIASVGCEWNEIVLRLRSGERVVLTTGSGRALEETREALARRIEEARAAYATRAGGAGIEALLAPGGRAIEAWVREMRKLTTEREYRAASLDAERLLHVATDAATPAATRVGAALALSASITDDDRARLRIASEVCADPRLRVALRRVADGASPEEIDEAAAAVAAVAGRG